MMAENGKHLLADSQKVHGGRGDHLLSNGSLLHDGKDLGT